MLVELSIPLVVTFDVMGWFGIHMGMVYFTKYLPDSWFDHNRWPYRQYMWENDGSVYERIFLIRKWKGILPDGSVMIRGGFRKNRLERKSVDYFKRFILETCRGELTHWLAFLAFPIFLIWNRWWVIFIMFAYASLANFPCIIVQRYNRLRFAGLLKNHYAIKKRQEFSSRDPGQ